MDRHNVRDRAAVEFDIDRLLDTVVSALQTARRGESVQVGATI
jgi:hypothetical protein